MEKSIQSIFGRCVVDGPHVKLPEQLDRKVYETVAKILKNNAGKWVGGKTQSIVFNYDPKELLRRLSEGEEVNTKKAFQFFPTPPEVVDFMLQVCLPLGSLRILEPSAGQGHIIEAIIAFGGCSSNTFDCVELEPLNRGILESKGMNLVGDDFLKFEPDELYDMVIANPPFNTNGSSDGYIDHLMKMNECTKTLGTVTAVVPSSFKTKQSKRVKEFKKFIEDNDGELCIYDLSEKSFLSSGTGVATCVIHWIVCRDKKEVKQKSLF